MKKFIKKFAVGLLAATIIVGSSFTSLAASYCLNVRDYGCHNYRHRDRGNVESAVAMGMTTSGKVHYIVTVNHWGECMCGEWGIIEMVTQYDVYK